MASIDTILPFILAWEGGSKFTNDPDDAGGPTKYGVTQGALSTYLGKKVTATDVKNMTLATATAVYKKDFWDKVSGDQLPNGLALIIFDGAVNHGVSIILDFVQQATHTTGDGKKMSTETLNKIKSMDGQAVYMLIVAIANLRRIRYETRPNADKYLKGWMNRLNDIQNKALAYENKYVVKKPEAEVEEEPIMEEVTSEAPKETTTEEKDDFIPSDQLSKETIQKLLQEINLYDGKIDGIIGTKSKTAITSILTKAGVNSNGWTDDRKLIAVGQYFASQKGIVAGKIDGLYGPQTRQAFLELNYLLEKGVPMPPWRKEEITNTSPVVINPTTNVWPLEKDVPKFYGDVGKNQVLLQLPYPMKLSWDLGTKITKISCHAKVHDSLKIIFQKTLEHYGQEQITKLGLDLFGGSLNVRPKRGGTSYSMHAWGIAVDLDPERNQLSWGKDKANFAKPEYEAFWNIVESEGWISLGRTKNYDWMHFQAARV